MIQYNQEYNNQIRKICEENPTSYATILKIKAKSYLLGYIIDCTREFLGEDTSILGKRINFLLNEMQEFPKCHNPKCNNRVIGYKTVKWNSSWPLYCCRSCISKDPENMRKIRQSKKDRYGDENYNGDIEEIKRKNRERYGTDWFFNSEEGKKKVKEGWLEHGYDHPMHCQHIKDEMSERYMKEHGVPYSCLNPEVMKKAKLPYFYEGVYFKSSWELAYYIYLEDNNKIFEYQPRDYFPYVDDKGKTRYYFPDFKVEDMLVEIKGDQFIKENGEYKNPYDTIHETDGIYEAKRKCMVENNIKILTKEDLKGVFEYCTRKFNGDSKWALAYKIKERPKNSILDITDLRIDLDVGNLMKEYEYFRTKYIGKDDKIGGCCSQNSIVKYFQQDVFYKRERDLWKNDECTKNKLIENRCKFLKKKVEDLTVNDVLLGFKYSGLYYGYSHFNPLWFKWFINHYDIKTCYDPCGGWGHRLLGGLNLEKYIYNDYSKTTKENVDRMIGFFKIKNTITYNEDCRKFVPEEKFEAMFTCVPYYNLERYECGDFKDLKDYNGFFDSIFEVFKTRNDCRIFGLVIREDLLTYSHKDFKECFPLSKEKSSHLTNQKRRKYKEYLYVYVK